MNKKYSLAVILLLEIFLLTGCGVLSFTGQVISATGKVAVTTGKVAIKTLEFAGKAVVATGKVITSVVTIPFGKTAVKLDKEGDTLSAKTLLNRKVRANLIVDTGSTSTQISQQTAEKLGIKPNAGKSTQCTLADGSVITCREVVLKEIRVGRARAYNVRAIILDREIKGRYDGLLGMSFLNNFTFEIDAEKGKLLLKKKK